MKYVMKWYYFHAKVSDLERNPRTSANMRGRFDGGVLTSALPGVQAVLVVGQYAWDGNPFIGFLANINAWSRTMDTGELRRRTLCNQTVLGKVSMTFLLR